MHLSLGRALLLMHREAVKRDAPVFRAERMTKTPFDILVFTTLSARTRDETTMAAMVRLSQSTRTKEQAQNTRGKTKKPKQILEPKQILAFGQEKLERLLYGVGFHRVKAKHLIAMCRMLDARGGTVPDTLEGLLELPGVGRKTANIVLVRAFGKTALGVDVHVHRLSNRLGLVRTKKPEDTEHALVKTIPKKHLRSLNRTFVAFGQTVCLPRKPKCAECPILRMCPRIGV